MKRSDSLILKPSFLFCSENPKICVGFVVYLQCISFVFIIKLELEKMDIQ